MTRKSHKSAARYGAASRRGRRQQRQHFSPKAPPPEQQEVEAAKPSSTMGLRSKAVAEPRSHELASGRRYLGLELRRLGIISGVILVILIALAFALR